MNLDDERTITTYDPSGMGQRLSQLAEQCGNAWDEGGSLPLPQDYGDVDHIVVAGMGGSAVMGDLLRDLAAYEGASPVSTCRDYRLPSGVGERSLVIASSYSGETEETLSCFTEALQRGAKVLTVAHGGHLMLRSEESRIPILPVPAVGEPRTALAYTFIASLAILCRLGLMKDKSHDVQEAVRASQDRLASWKPSSATADNEAKQIALDLQSKVIAVYGSGLLAGVAHRWKTQFNENSKTWSFAEVFPELDHNSVEGYSSAAELKDKMFVILLKSNRYDPRITRRYDVTQAALDEKGVPNRLVQAQEPNALADMLTTTFLGDFTSYYLALLNRTDPSETPILAGIKASLSQT